MKRLILLAMILAFIAVFGFVGCDYFDDDETNQTGPETDICKTRISVIPDIDEQCVACFEVLDVMKCGLVHTDIIVDGFEHITVTPGSVTEYKFSTDSDVHTFEWVSIFQDGSEYMDYWRGYRHPNCWGPGSTSDLMLTIRPRPGWGQDDILMTLIGFDDTVSYTILYGETSPPMIPKDTIIGWPAAGYGTESIYPTTYWQVKSSSGEVSNIVPYSWPE